MFMPLTLVLSVGFKSSILENRNLILQTAGYTVVSAFSIGEAVERFQAGDFDLVILGSFIPAKDRERLACLIRASGSRTPIISVSEKPGRWDAVVNTTLEDDPNTFLIGIREVLSKAGEGQAVLQVMHLDHQGDHAPKGKKPPISSAGYEQQQQTTKAAKASAGALISKTR